MVHLVGYALEPVLRALDAGDHGSEFRANNSLGVERLAKYLALIDPSMQQFMIRMCYGLEEGCINLLQAFFHDHPLSADAGSCHSPSTNKDGINNSAIPMAAAIHTARG